MKPYERRAAQRAVESAFDGMNWIIAAILGGLALAFQLPLWIALVIALGSAAAMIAAPAVPALIRGRQGDSPFQIEAGVLDRNPDRPQYQLMEQLSKRLERIRQLRDSDRLDTNVKDAAIQAYEAGKLAVERGALLAEAMDTLDSAIEEIAPTGSNTQHGDPEAFDAAIRLEARRMAMERKLRSTTDSLRGVHTGLVETNATVKASGIVGEGQLQLESISESLAELRDLVDKMEEGDLPQVEGPG